MTYTEAIKNKKLKLNKNLKFVNFADLLKKSMKDPKFKKAWNDLDVEFQIIRSILDKRIEKDMSQKELAKKIGTNQATLSRLETGNANPSLKFLKRVAKALDAELKISLI